MSLEGEARGKEKTSRGLRGKGVERRGREGAQAQEKMGKERVRIGERVKERRGGDT